MSGKKNNKNWLQFRFAKWVCKTNAANRSQSLNADVLMPVVRRPMHNRSGYNCVGVIWLKV